MNKESPMSSSAPTADHPVSYRRSDELQRQIVDHAIGVQRASNTVAALEYLMANDVNPDVISRVLLEPAKRRHCEA